uniref:Ig-like domain-containing protein n=1 Tax=Salvator merianae TaxID=96440 RepID=A0A8D0CCP4_SALMN
MIMLHPQLCLYSVVQFPSEVVAIVGDTITLKCAFSIQAGKPSPAKGAMSWFRGPSETKSEVIPGGRFSLSYPDTFHRPGEGQLMIANVSLEDAGCYTCQVMLWGEGEARGNGIKLHVYGKSNPLFALLHNSIYALFSLHVGALVLSTGYRGI